MHPAVPFAGQHRARPDVGGQAVRIHGTLAGGVRRPCLIKQPLALGIQIAKTVGLKPIGQNPKQQMSRQVRGRPPPVPTVNPKRLTETGESGDSLLDEGS